MIGQITWSCKTFQDLSLEELYGILSLRQAVFIVEQNCAYLDSDGKDSDSLHLCAYDVKGGLVAYARLLPKGISYTKYASIGRVVTASSLRGKGFGRPLMQHAIKYLHEAWGEQSIKISAQHHLRFYYHSLGFEPIGEIYDEDGIPHIAMIFSMDN